MEQAVLKPDYESSVVSNEDLSYILGENHKYTWDEFYETLEMERASGKEKCTQASYIALEILTPQLMQMPFRSTRTNSDTHKDFLQNAYITILEHIDGFDRSQSTFKTYITKWFQGLARETRNDGISNYQSQKLGYRVYSTEALVLKGKNNGECEYVLEHADEKGSAEDMYEAEDKVRSNALLHQVMGISNIDDIEEKRDIYTDAACFHKFLGGIENISDDTRAAIAEVVAEGDDYQ